MSCASCRCGLQGRYGKSGLIVGWRLRLIQPTGFVRGLLDGGCALSNLRGLRADCWMAAAPYPTYGFVGLISAAPSDVIFSHPPYTRWYPKPNHQGTSLPAHHDETSKMANPGLVEPSHV